MCCRAWQSRGRRLRSRLRGATTGASLAVVLRQVPRGRVQRAAHRPGRGNPRRGTRVRGPAASLRQGCRCSSLQRVQGSGGERGCGAPGSSTGLPFRPGAAAVVTSAELHSRPLYKLHIACGSGCCRWSIGCRYSLLRLAHGGGEGAGAGSCRGLYNMPPCVLFASVWRPCSWGS